jgi:predicted RNA-binding protein
MINFFGGENIKQKKLINKKNNSKESKFWIHKFEKDFLKELDSVRLLASEKKFSRALKNIRPNDKIIIYSTLDIERQKNICFIAYTMVEDVYQDKKTLYESYSSPSKLKLRGIKYFTVPVIAKDIADELYFIKDKKKSSYYLSSEYKEISEQDFRKILRKTNLTKEYPAYFESVSFSLEDFLLNSIYGLYVIIKRTQKGNQFEIKKFLRLFRKLLKEYGVIKSNEEVEEFYAKNVWKLGLKHNPSRDPDKFVVLYNRFGKKRNFSYISLE